MDNVFLLVSFLLGLIFGSFLNCLIWRLRQGESILGRSYCPSCRHLIAWHDNIPVLSFLFLKGRCRYCKNRISWQYPLVELITALLFAFSFYTISQVKDFSPILLVFNWLFIFGLILIFIYDLRWQSVPMIFVWPFTVIIFFINILLGIPWWQLVIVGAVGGLFFLVQFLLTKRKGVGEGDIWLGLLMGVALARFDLLILALVLSYFIGAIISVLLLVSNKKKLKSKIALGPFLVSGTLISLIFGVKIINWYFGLF